MPDSRREPGGNSPAEREKLLQLNNSISKVVAKLYKQRGMTQGDFADKIGYSRVSVNLVFKNSDSTARMWKLQYLVPAAEVLGVRVSDIIAAAESGTDVTLEMQIADTKPKSDERIERILQIVMGCADDDSEAGAFAKIVYSVRAMRGFARGLYKRYMDGEIGDGELYAILLDAKEKAESHVGEDENDDRVLWSFIK